MKRFRDEKISTSHSTTKEIHEINVHLAQIDSCIAQIGCKSANLQSRPHRKVVIPILEICYAGPHIVVGGAKDTIGWRFRRMRTLWR